MKVVGGNIRECCPELGHSRAVCEGKWSSNPTMYTVPLKILKFFESCSFVKLQAIVLECCVLSRQKISVLLGLS